MSRAERLLELLQLLREHRFAMTGQALSDALNVSVRTVYRDINSLRAQGANIEGSPGTGYLLTERFTLPPLTFQDDELLALSLGLRWVKKNTDPELVKSAERVLAKINAVISSQAKIKFNEHGITVLQSQRENPYLFQIRSAIQQGLKLQIQYTDLANKTTSRVIWPCALGFFDDTSVFAAWCELRQAFRNFRMDRISALTQLEPYPVPVYQLLKEWQKEACIDLKL